jgi:hypothetical protein
MALRLSFRALTISLELLATSEEASSSSSRGIRPLTAPLPFDRPCVHSRRPRPPSGRRCHPSTVFRPRGLSPPRRFAPHRGCGFVAPRCRLWGSTRFPSRLPAHPRVPCKAFAFPAPRVIPFEEFPSSAAVPHHCGLCPPAIAARSPCPDLLDRSRAWRRPCSRSCLVAAGSPPRAGAVVGVCNPSSRGCPGCGTARLAEAVEAGVHPRWPKPALMRVRRFGPRPSSTHSPDLRRGPTSWSGLSGDRGRRPTPEGADSPHRPGPVWCLPSAEASGWSEEPVRCLGDAPIRRGGPPRHQPGASSLPASRPAPPPSRVVP